MRYVQRPQAGGLRSLLGFFSPWAHVSAARARSRATPFRTHLDLERPADLAVLAADLEGFFDAHPRSVMGHGSVFVEQSFGAFVKGSSGTMVRHHGQQRSVVRCTATQRAEGDVTAPTARSLPSDDLGPSRRPSRPSDADRPSGRQGAPGIKTPVCRRCSTRRSPSRCAALRRRCRAT